MKHLTDRLIQLPGELLVLLLVLALAGGGFAVLACIYWIATL